VCLGYSRECRKMFVRRERCKGFVAIEAWFGIYCQGSRTADLDCLAVWGKVLCNDEMICKDPRSRGLCSSGDCMLRTWR